MLNMCICDDNRADFAAIKALAADFTCNHPEFPIRTWGFHSPFELLEHLEGKNSFDIYLLDVVMPHFSGIELARRIRERRETAEILFLTISREYAIDAFRVQASDYLLKPLNRTDFEQTLLHSIQRLSSPDAASLAIKTQEGIRKITLRELMLVESFNHSCSFSLANGVCLRTGSTLSSLMEQLGRDLRFFSPHRSYIVNMDYISGLTASGIILSDGRRVPVSRKLQNALKEAYSRYLFR